MTRNYEEHFTVQKFITSYDHLPDVRNSLIESRNLKKTDCKCIKSFGFSKTSKYSFECELNLITNKE